MDTEDCDGRSSHSSVFDITKSIHMLSVSTETQGIRIHREPSRIGSLFASSILSSQGSLDWALVHIESLFLWANQDILMNRVVGGEGSYTPKSVQRTAVDSRVLMYTGDDECPSEGKLSGITSFIKAQDKNEFEEFWSVQGIEGNFGKL